MSITIPSLPEPVLQIREGSEADTLLQLVRRVGAEAAAQFLTPKAGAEPDFKDLLLPDNLKDKKKTSWILQNIPTANQLSNKPLTWVIENMILENGLHLFSGKQGSMKSMTAMLLADTITSNKSFMGRKSIGHSITVVYIDRENPEAEIRKRCAALGLLKRKNFLVWGDWQPDNQPPLTFDDPRLLESASRDNVLFVFDSLSSYLNGADENDSGAMMEIMGKARKLARSCAGVIVLHHQPKNGGAGSRGSTSIPASSDMAFVVEKAGNDVTLSEERFRPCSGYTMKWTMDFGDVTGVYTYKVISNGLSGSRANVDQEESAASDAAEGHRIMTDHLLIQRAKAAIDDAYSSGRPAPSQGQLATLLGITSQRKRTEILNGASNRPWDCIPGRGRGVVFVPKQKKLEKKFEQENPIPSGVDPGPPLELS